MWISITVCRKTKRTSSFPARLPSKLHNSNDLFSDCQNVELLCNILVVADQMLVTRLKEICEAVIATLSKWLIFSVTMIGDFPLACIIIM